MIEFIEEGHYYLLDGVIVPSVSEIIRFKFPEAYAGIPEQILKKKATYGTKLHRTIEEFIEGECSLQDIQKRRIDPNIKIAVEEFERLRREWIFSIDKVEQIVHWGDHYAGTFDLKCKDGLIIDLKSTSEVHMDWLQLQLSLYYMADNNPQKHGYCMWFPKGSPGKVIQVETLSFDECKEIVKDFEASRK